MTRQPKYPPQERRKCGCASEQWDKWYGDGVRIFEKRKDDMWECLQCGEMKKDARQRRR